MLECARTFQNYRAIVALEQNILCHAVGEKRKKIHVSSNRERIGRIPLIREQRYYYFIIRLRIIFNGNKLHRYD